MSRAYRIAVKESLSRHVQVEDGIASTLELLPILAPERMRELLAAELAQRGFTREGGAARRQERGGVTVEVTLDTGAVTVSAEGHEELQLSTERSAVTVEEHGEQRRAELEAAARRTLEAEAQARRDALQQRVTLELEGHLRDLKGELDGVVNRVTATALKQRAAELGQVEEIHEQPDGGLIIKVRV